VTFRDIRANESVVKHGDRILSAYRLTTGAKIYVITDAVGDYGKRASTCVMLTSDS
jgi:hypothetical protein